MESVLNFIFQTLKSFFFSSALILFISKCSLSLSLTCMFLFYTQLPFFCGCSISFHHPTTPRILIIGFSPQYVCLDPCVVSAASEFPLFCWIGFLPRAFSHWPCGSWSLNWHLRERPQDAGWSFVQVALSDRWLQEGDCWDLLILLGSSCCQCL